MLLPGTGKAKLHSSVSGNLQRASPYLHLSKLPSRDSFLSFYLSIAKHYVFVLGLPICFISIIWCYFRLPEFKGRSYYELDVLFQRRIPARKFKTTAVEPEADRHLEE